MLETRAGASPAPTWLRFGGAGHKAYRVRAGLAPALAHLKGGTISWLTGIVALVLPKAFLTRRV